MRKAGLLCVLALGLAAAFSQSARAADTSGAKRPQRSSAALMTVRSKKRSPACARASPGAAASATQNNPIHRDAGRALMRVLVIASFVSSDLATSTDSRRRGLEARLTSRVKRRG